MCLKRHAENLPKTWTSNPFADRTLDAVWIPLDSIYRLNRISIDCLIELTDFEYTFSSYERVLLHLESLIGVCMFEFFLANFCLVNWSQYARSANSSEWFKFIRSFLTAVKTCVAARVIFIERRCKAVIFKQSS